MSADIVAVPRDPNPYQELLYSRMRAAGHRVTYAGELTSSRTLNLLLMPLELPALRLRGYRILHLHWTFNFAILGSERRPRLRRLSRWWFQLILTTARLAGLRIVWTAHNLLPHNQVFDDDERARRFLVAHADLVIAHSVPSLAEIERAFGTPARSVVIPIAATEPPGLGDLSPLRGDAPRTVLFFGLVEPYKGVEDLLIAARRSAAALHLHIAGRCQDPRLAERIRQLAEQADDVTLSLRFVPDEEIHQLFAAADAVAFPYRRVTTSSAVTLAAVAARPILVPDLPAFAHFPDTACIRYRPGLAGLADALDRVATMSSDDLREMGAASRQALAGTSWDDSAALTSRAFDGLGR